MQPNLPGAIGSPVGVPRHPGQRVHLAGDVRRFACLDRSDPGAKEIGSDDLQRCLHIRVIDTAEFGATHLIGAYLCWRGADMRCLPRHRVLLDSERWNPEGVLDIGRGNVEAHWPVDRQHERCRVALSPYCG